MKENNSRVLVGAEQDTFLQGLISSKMGRVIGELCIIASAILFGLMPLLAKVAYEHGSNPYTVSFGRYAFGSLILLLILTYKEGERLTISLKQLAQIAGLAVFFGSTSILLYISYDYIGTGLATTLHFTYPVAVIFIAAYFFHERLDLGKIACTILCLAGIGLLYTPGASSGILGMLIAAASGLTYSVYIILLGKSDLNKLPPLTLSFWISLLSAVEVGLVAFGGGHLRFDLGLPGWGAELALAIMAAVFATTLFQMGVMLSGEIKASLLSTFEPLTGVLVGLLVFQEELTFKIGLGILCILCATVFLVANKKKQLQ